MIQRRKMLGLIPGALGLAALPSLAQQSDKPVRMVVGYPAGGGVDISARVTAAALRGVYGDSVVVDNRPGAGGRIGIDLVKNAEADGNTILVAPNFVFTIYPHIYRKLAYDLSRDLAPVSSICSIGYSVSVGPGVPLSVKTIADYAQWLRANPDKASFGSGSAGTTPHFTGVMLSRALNVPLVHVGYKGGAPLSQDLIGGQVPMAVQSLPEAYQLVKAGRIRSLAVSTPQRSPLMPDVPTLAESGFPDLIVADVFGAFVPIKTPEDRVRRLASAIQTAIAKPESQEALHKLTFQPQTVALAAYARSISQEHRGWEQVVQASGFKAEE
ncbi:MAG TPA: tripartite tricarboxylate transporter substrate-binding protein [Ramlibacter sp.]|nr:tripartite tricarboxylate transporter substrate-binding protein [Ramlibacter sp.]